MTVWTGARPEHRTCGGRRLRGGEAGMVRALCRARRLARLVVKIIK